MTLISRHLQVPNMINKSNTATTRTGFSEVKGIALGTQPRDFVRLIFAHQCAGRWSVKRCYFKLF